MLTHLRQDDSDAQGITLFAEASSIYDATVQDLLLPSNDLRFSYIPEPYMRRFRKFYCNSKYLCQYVTCTSRAEGFDTERERDRHERSHQPRFYCDDLQCSFKDAIGFPSVAALRRHTRSYHSMRSNILVFNKPLMAQHPPFDMARQQERMQRRAIAQQMGQMPGMQQQMQGITPQQLQQLQQQMQQDKTGMHPGQVQLPVQIMLQQQLLLRQQRIQHNQQLQQQLAMQKANSHGRRDSETELEYRRRTWHPGNHSSYNQPPPTNEPSYHQTPNNMQRHIMDPSQTTPATHTQFMTQGGQPTTPYPMVNTRQNGMSTNDNTMGVTQDGMGTMDVRGQHYGGGSIAGEQDKLSVLGSPFKETKSQVGTEQPDGMDMMRVESGYWNNLGTDVDGVDMLRVESTYPDGSVSFFNL